MNARTCIAVDSSCDLPAQFIREHNIEVLPIYIRHAGGRQLDYRNPKSTLQFYLSHSREKYGLAQSEPLSVQDMTEILRQRLLPKYDLVQVVTINSRKSEVFKRVSEAALVNEPRFREISQQQPERPPFRIRLHDSMSMFTGHALLVYELVKRVRIEKAPLNRSIREIDQMRDQVYGYIVPNDLSYMRVRRHMRKSDHKISWLSFRQHSKPPPHRATAQGRDRKNDHGQGVLGQPGNAVCPRAPPGRTGPDQRRHHHELRRAAGGDQKPPDPAGVSRRLPPPGHQNHALDDEHDRHRQRRAGCVCAGVRHR